eukprot:CAMPEP_0119393140 /NCGR_PEP_ID=MMETSP1334-20130426/124359_1 /TAXON_ID=127549 /ORGANISM="Calcidiscus leptoporus, Strain RCC1130" /LENGTH=64 /DNA_ID=CAMNT_0007416147 /DNA_START=135 /DNA_END=327 /DNA_ORIENTATION=+
MHRATRACGAPHTKATPGGRGVIASNRHVEALRLAHLLLQPAACRILAAAGLVPRGARRLGRLD